jgi:hypothetical protein
MGLDSVEILMKVENTFGISIPDEEAEKILTVGDFHDSVWRHLTGKHSDKCKSQHLFYTLRKSFADSFGCSPREVTLDISPELIFPRASRRQRYLGFADSVNLKLPPLVLTSRWLTFLKIYALLTIIGGLAISVVLIGIFDYSKWTLLTLVIPILLTLLLSKLLDPKRIVIEEATMKEFIQRTLPLNYPVVIANEGTNRQEMETVINYIIADMAGLEIEEVTSDKKIGYDLGID